MIARTQNMLWPDILELRVIQRIATIIRKRWGLGLLFLSPDGTIWSTGGPDPAEPAQAGECALAPSSEEGAPWRGGVGPLCRLARQVPGGAESCEASARAVFEAVRPAAEGALVREPRVIGTCAAGLQQVVVPIVLGEELTGMACSEGFWTDRLSAGRLPGRSELRVSRTQWDAAAKATPCLDPEQLGFLEDLVTSAAQEAEAFQREACSAERRVGLGAEARRYSYDFIIGQSRAMTDLYRVLDKVIASDATVLVQGENGTGKELIAKAIHYNSSRKDRRFVVQNCSAFNDNLLDSELFGHKRGSFTGAVSDTPGLFEVADGSTFFLDEIGDMSPALQVKLLRVLQEGTFIPVGDTQPKHVDVRIIAATNRDLKEMVQRGQFREDLYYRINVIKLTAPPLRERREDIPPLVEHFMRKHAAGGPDSKRSGSLSAKKRLSRACMSRLMSYGWPGNVRELENEIERLIVLAGDEKLITEDLLSPRICQPFASPEQAVTTVPDCLPEAVAQLERTMIYEVLKRNHWNKTRAAQELRISRRNLIRKVDKYKLDQRKR